MQVELNVAETYAATRAAELSRERLRVLQKAERINAQSEDSGELDGFKITAAQCSAINAGDREAVDKFFAENAKRLKLLARTFLYRLGIRSKWDSLRHKRFIPYIEVEDCLNQLYVDMRRGFVVFALVPHMLPRVICHSFRYCEVGGFGEEDGVYINNDFRRAAQNVGAQ